MMDKLRTSNLRSAPKNHPIYALPGLSAYLDVEDLSGLSLGNAVASWPNRVNAALPYAQANASLRPTYNTYDGLPAVYMTPGQYLQAAFTATGKRHCYWFAVMRYTPVNTEWQTAVGFWGSSYAYTFCSWYQGAIGYNGAASNMFGTNFVAYQCDQWHVFSGRVTNGFVSMSRLRINKADYTQSMRWLRNGDSAPQFGASLTVTMGAPSYAGYVKFRTFVICMTDEDISPAYIGQAEQFLLDKNGLRAYSV